MTRVLFSDLFRQNLDGSIEPLKTITLNGVTFGPGVRISRGVLLGGIDLTLFAGKDLEVTEQAGTSTITAIYQ